ncbi:MAG: MotA/TolQ/ExbB proton channel family protein [Spirochaetaceae bacterium]|jgi:biopolymer transport protein ExbB|nr:MotA/TolQ/ExbB proton channel family protein [Spirochaetaceae bacterium]
MDSGTVSFSLLELFKMGGIFMWPLLFFSIAVIAISLERAIYLGYHNLRMDDIAQKVERYIDERNITGAREYLSGLTVRRMGARILLILLNRSGLEENQGGAERRKFSEHRIERAVETETMNNINSLENGFNFLTALGSLSPLTGFLGTVSGMIGAFRSIAEATEVNAQIVANGIYEALITTVFGLIIAIIAMISHSIFSHIVDKFAADVEKACSELITTIADRHEA